VPIGEQADQQAIDEIFLPHDDSGDLLLKRLDPVCGFFDLLCELLSGRHGKG
jgi:hypothetical protein